MRKFLSILLSVAMLMTVLPASIGFAAPVEGETAKYTLTFRDGDRDGVVELGEELTYTWKFDSGYEYVNNLDFNIEYNADYLTPKSLTGKIISVTDDNWEVKPEENKITGYLMATGNVWTKEEVEDEDTGDISVNKLNLLVAKFTVKEDVPANTKANIVLNITNYQKYDNGGVDVPVEVAQYGEFTINPQEAPKSSDATLKSLKYGDASIELVADKYDYEAYLPLGTVIPAITAVANDEKASVANAVVEDNVATITVTAEDGSTQEYTITFTFKAAQDLPIEQQPNKIYDLKSNAEASKDPVKEENNAYQTEEEAAKTDLTYMVIGENFSADSYLKYNKNTKYTGFSSDMLGASYFRTIRYHGGFNTYTVKNQKEGTLIKKRVYDQPDGGYTETEAESFGDGAAVGAVRTYTNLNTPAYAEDGVWFSFRVTSDCTVVVRDNSKYGYPGINPEYSPEAGWTKSDDTQASLGSSNLGASYWKSFNAGDLVEIPSYGRAGKLSDTTKVEYFYTNADGEEVKLATTDVAHATFFTGWEGGCVVAVKWEKTLDNVATLKSLSVDGCDIALKSDTYEYSTEVFDLEDIAVEAETTSEKATCDYKVADGKLTVTVEAEDETTKEYVVSLKVASKPIINIKVGTNTYSAHKMVGYDAVEGYSIYPKTLGEGYETSADAMAVGQAIIDGFNQGLEEENAHYGSNFYSGYPYARANEVTADGVKTYTAALDNPDPVSSESINSLGGEAWVIKNGKGHTFKNNPIQEGDNLGVFGSGTVVSFAVSKPGTACVVDISKVGFNNEGWTKNGTLNGHNVYTKHFDAGLVEIPGSNVSWATLESKMNSSKRIANTPGYIFVFDDLSDASLKEITYTADKEYTIAVDGDEIEINVVPGVESITITSAVGKLAGTTIVPVEIAAGETGALFAFSPDGTPKNYTVKVVKEEEYKIIMPTSNGDAWYDGIYGTKELKAFGNNIVAIEGISTADSDTLSAWAERIDKEKMYVGPSINNATAILTPRNAANPGTTDIKVYRQNEAGEWVNDAEASFTRQIEGEEAETFTGVKYNSSGSIGFRHTSNGSLDKPFFAGDYSGKDGEWWITFVPTSDCTVVLSDWIGYGWENLNKDEWTPAYYKYLDKTKVHSYSKHFKAGEVVQIPNYGMISSKYDTRNVTYTYNDKDGELQTKTMKVYQEWQNWMNIGMLVVWDDFAIASDAKTLLVDGVEIEGFNAETKEYVYSMEKGVEEVELTAAIEGTATATGLGKYKAGETATVVITAGDGKTQTTYTVVFRAKSADTTLAWAKLGEEEITFDENGNYAVELPYGSEIPAVTYELNDANAKAEATTDRGTTTITVTAEDGTVKVYTVTVTIAKKLYTLTVSAANGTITATYQDKTGENWDTSAVKEFATGTEITLKAMPDEGAEFVYWMDNVSGRVVYYGAEYTITMGTNKNLTAVSAAAAGDVFTVEFTDLNNRVYVYSASNVEITVPADPYVLGYTFEGWAIDGVKTDYVAGDVIDANTFTADTKLEAIQTVDKTKYLVALIGANEEGGSFAYNTAITVTPAVPEGKVFAYWMRDGKVVSYNESYMFYVSNLNTTVEAVFEDEPVEAKATIAMAAPTVVAGNKISFMMERSVPEGLSVVEAGILLKEGVASVINLDNYDLKGTSVNTTAYGSYTIRKANVVAGASWSAVGYMIYTDGTDVYTIYTDVVVGTVKNPADYTPEYDRIEDGGDVL